MAKGNRGGKRAGGASANSNAKYNGFSITNQDGETENYIVMNGEVKFADLRRYDGFMGVSSLDSIQNAYDTFGGVQGIIDRINSVGKGKASVLSDKKVEQLQDDYKKKRAKADKQLDDSISGNKKSVNRHRAYWSAM